MYLSVFDSGKNPLGRYATSYDITKPITVQDLNLLGEGVSHKYPKWKSMGHGLVNISRDESLRYISAPKYSSKFKELGGVICREHAMYLLDKDDTILAVAPMNCEEPAKVFQDWGYESENLRILNNEFIAIIHDGIL